jgi:hypothetical protein
VIWLQVGKVAAPEQTGVSFGDYGNTMAACRMAFRCGKEDYELGQTVTVSAWL